MELVSKETVYHYKISQIDKLVLGGVLIRILQDGEIKVDDDETKEILKRISDGLKTT